MFPTKPIGQRGEITNGQERKNYARGGGGKGVWATPLKKVSYTVTNSTTGVVVKRKGFFSRLGGNKRKKALKSSSEGREGGETLKSAERHCGENKRKNGIKRGGGHGKNFLRKKGQLPGKTEESRSKKSKKRDKRGLNFAGREEGKGFEGEGWEGVAW